MIYSHHTLSEQAMNKLATYRQEAAVVQELKSVGGNDQLASSISKAFSWVGAGLRFRNRLLESAKTSSRTREPGAEGFNQI